MTTKDAFKVMEEDGLTYGDAIMLVVSFVPEGESEVWPANSQKEFKEWTLERLQRYRERHNTANFNLKECHWQFGINLLREFG